MPHTENAVAPDVLTSADPIAMTRMLARVADADDARLAAAGGVDGVEMRLERAGSGEAVAPAAVRSVRLAFPGLLRLRIDAPERQPGAVEAAVALGADEIALPACAIPEAAAALRTTAPPARPVALVAVTLADRAGSAPPTGGPAHSMMLDVPEGGRLIDQLAIDHLDAFARGCRGVALPFGFAGGLEAPDVARLLLLRPDLLAFDLALRRDHRSDAPIDRSATAAIRALIPREVPDQAGPIAGAGGTDTVFVHDFVALFSIGAYRAERGTPQRVRFSVDAEVYRPKTAPSDMAGVFSYDIIIETVRVLAARGHVTFVETLAEDLATLLLAYPQLSAVTVKVEKLDVIEGALGVLIRRDRGTLLPGCAG